MGGFKTHAWPMSPVKPVTQSLRTDPISSGTSVKLVFRLRGYRIELRYVTPNKERSIDVTTVGAIVNMCLLLASVLCSNALQLMLTSTQRRDCYRPRRDVLSLLHWKPSWPDR